MLFSQYQLVLDLVMVCRRSLCAIRDSIIADEKSRQHLLKIWAGSLTEELLFTKQKDVSSNLSLPNLIKE